MANPFQSPVIISLCPGFLGLERGIERAIGKIRIAAYVEINAFVIDNILQGMEKGVLDAAPIWTDAKTFRAAPFRGKIDGIIGGYPCQPFSVAGKQLGSEDPRHLWPYIQQHISTIRPVWCFFENVRGHLTLGYDEVYKGLSNLGYAVEPGIYSAEEVGATHRRERLFILAIRKEWLENTANDRLQWKEFKQIIKRDFNSFSIKEASNMANTVCAGLWGNNIERVQSQPQRSGNGQKNELANATGNSTTGLREREEQEQEQEQSCLGDASNPKLGDANGINGGLSEPNQRQQNNDTARHGEAMADTHNSGSQQNTQPSQLRPNSIEQPPRNCGLANEAENNQRWLDKWPARPGQPQHEWEAPRTVITEQAARLLGGHSKKHPEGFLQWQIDQVAFNEFASTVKPGMGCEFNGYNFREDLLRAYGNSVVEQTAEKAFIKLIEKHLNNIKWANDN